MGTLLPLFISLGLILSPLKQGLIRTLRGMRSARLSRKKRPPGGEVSLQDTRRDGSMESMDAGIRL